MPEQYWDVDSGRTSPSKLWLTARDGKYQASITRTGIIKIYERNSSQVAAALPELQRITIDEHFVDRLNDLYDQACEHFNGACDHVSSGEVAHRG